MAADISRIAEALTAEDLLRAADALFDRADIYDKRFCDTSAAMDRGAAQRILAAGRRT